MKSTASIITASIAVSGLAFAAGAFGAAMNDLPMLHTHGEVSYLSGGIGLTEANAIKRVAKSYPLELEFVQSAKPKDMYLADVEVRIRDAQGKTVLDATSDGPFLLAKLPAGKYSVRADRDGRPEQRQIEVAAKGHQHIVFAWKS